MSLLGISVAMISATLLQKSSLQPGVIVDRYSNLNRFSGAVLVAKNGQMIYEGARGYANLELKVRNSPSTKFNIGSLSKQFVAAAILKLAQDGKLSLSDPIQKHITEYPLPQGQQVTIHHLLNHSSGIPSIGRRDGLTNVDWDGNATSLQNIIELSWKLPLQFLPGSEYRYNNTGYAVLASIIERVGKRPYGEWMNEELFKPCGLTETEIIDGKSIITGMASGYQGYYPDYQLPTYVHPSWQAGMGGICSSVRDLHRWMGVLQTSKFLNDDFRKLLFSHQIARARPRTYYGYGWFMSPRGSGELIWSGGTVEGFVCNLYWVPTRNYWSIAMCNNPPQVGVDVSDEILNQLLLHEEQQPITAPPEIIAVSQPILKRVEGEYDFGNGMLLKVELRAGKLITDAAGSSSWSLGTVSDQIQLDTTAPILGTAMKILDAFLKGDASAAEPFVAPERRSVYATKQVEARKSLISRRGEVQKISPIRVVKDGAGTIVAFRLSQSRQDRYVHFEFNSAGMLVGDYYADTLPARMELKPVSDRKFFIDGFPYESPDQLWDFRMIEGKHYLVKVDEPKVRAVRIR